MTQQKEAPTHWSPFFSHGLAVRGLDGHQEGESGGDQRVVMVATRAAVVRRVRLRTFRLD
jgi:hypothetical protein